MNARHIRSKLYLRLGWKTTTEICLWKGDMSRKRVTLEKTREFQEGDYDR